MSNLYSDEKLVQGIFRLRCYEASTDRALDLYAAAPSEETRMAAYTWLHRLEQFAQHFEQNVEGRSVAA